MKILPIMLVMLAFTASAEARKVDLLVLRDIICEVETRGHPYPSTAMSAEAIGQCQITIATAHSHGYRNVIDVLLDSREIALKVLKRCLRWGHKDVYRLAYCYHAGPRARQGQGPKTKAYALEVSALYRARTQAKPPTLSRGWGR